jgi:erythromycin esterase
MAENLKQVVDRERADTKCVIWAHNAHISVKNYYWPGESNMGSCLRDTYGDQYFAFGFEFNHGSYQTRMLLPDNILGDLKEVTLAPAPVGSFPWYVSATHVGHLLLSLRTPAGTPAVEQWRATPQVVHNVPWVYDEPSRLHAELSMQKHYDGIIFIETTTPTRPTVNGLKTVANRALF